MSAAPNIWLNGTSDWSYDLVGNCLSQNSSLTGIESVSERYSANDWLNADQSRDHRSTLTHL